MTKRAWRVAGLILAAALLLPVLAILLLQTGPARRYLLEKVQALLLDQGIRLEAGDVTYNLAGATARLDRIRLTSTAAPDLPSFLEAGSATVDVGIISYARGFLHLEDARFKDVKVRMITDERGRTNLPVLPDSQPEPQGRMPDFLIEHLEASPIYLLYENRADQIRVEVPAARLRIDGRMPFTHRIFIEGQRPGSVTFQGTTAPIDTLKVEAEVPGNLSGVTIQDFRLRSDRSQASLTGRIEDWKDPRVDFEVRASLAVEQLARFAALQEPLGGTAVLTARGTGTVANLAVRGDLAGYQVRYGQFTEVSLEAAFDWERRRESVRLDSLTVDSPDASIGGSGLVVLSDEAGSSATLDIRRADLAGLSRRLGLPITIDSGAAGRVAATWPGLQFGAVSGEADIRLTPRSGAAGRDRVPLRGVLKIRLEDRNLRASLDRVSLPGVVADGGIRVDAFHDLAEVGQGRLSGRVDLDFEDLASFYPNLIGFLGKSDDPTLGRIKPSGRAGVSATFGGTVSQPGISASLVAPSLAVGPVGGLAVTAEATVTPARLEVQSLALKLDGQSADIKGTVGLSEARSPIALELVADNIDLGNVLKMLELDYPVSGAARVQAHAKGTIDSPLAEAKVHATGLQAYEEPFGEVSADLSFADQVVRVDRLVLSKSAGGSGSSGGLSLSGSYNLNSQSYQVDAVADKLTFEHLRLPGQSPLAGVVTLRANGSGTIADPQLDLHLDMEGAKFEGYEIPRVALTGDLRSQVARFRLVSPPVNLQVNGQVGIAPPYAAEAQAELVQMDLAALPPSLLGADIQGRVTVHARATAPLARPEEATVQATVTDLLLRAAGRQIENTGPVELAYADEVLRIASASFASGASFLTLSGSMPLESSEATGRVEIRGNIDVAESLAPLLGTSYSLEGKLSLEGSVDGSFESLAPSLNAALQNGRFAAPQLSEAVQDINLQASLRDGQLDLTRLDARLGPGRLQARGRVPLGAVPGLPRQIQRRDGSAELTVQVDDFSLGSMAGLPEDLTGTVSLQADLGAADARLESLTGSLTFNQMNFRVAGIDLRQDRPAKLLVDGGKARIEHFALVGPETRIQASGTLNLAGEREAELQANGRIDLALLSVFAQDLEASGQTEFRVDMGGTVANPRMDGFVSLEGGELSLQSPSIQVSDLRARVELAVSAATIREFKGNMNGGSLSASGSAAVVNGVVRPDLRINAQGVFLDFPEGLQTVSDADLTMRSSGDLVNIGGLVAIQQGSYTDQLNVEQELLGLVGSSQAVAPSERDPLLARIRFDVQVESREPIVMDNNLAKIGADLDMRLVGNYYQPSLLGRLRLDEGGELYLRERTYYIERGVISFNNPVEIEPNLDLSARTQVNDLDITLRISGTADDIQTSLTSDPPMPETDLASLLVTGRTLEEARGEAGAVLQEQTLALLSGAFGGRLEAGLEDITGLSKVRIEPSLISPESDPTARLTIGQDLTNELALIYSMNLADSSDRIYIGEYDVTRRFIGRVVHETDPQDALEEGSKFRFEFRHDLRFGLGRQVDDDQRAPRAEDRRRITSLRFEGQSPFTEKQMAEKSGLEVGDRYDFFKVRQATERLKGLLIEKDHLEGTVRMSRENSDPESVSLVFRVVSGPQVRFRFEGFNPSGDVERSVRESWSKGVFEELRLELSRQAVLTALLLDGYMEARVESAIQAADDAKEVTFRVVAGRRFDQVATEFQGASSPVKERLEEQFGGPKAAARAQTSFREMEEEIQAIYRSEGYSRARVDPPVSRLDPSSGSAAVVFPISQGPRAELAEVEFEGNTVWSDEDLTRTSLLAAGQVFRPADRDQAVLRLRLAYAAAGYNDVVITPDVQSDPETGRVRLGFSIEEHRKEVVRALDVRGNGRTSERFITNLLAVSIGDPMTPEKVARSRRALYDTGAFALVELETEEIEWPGASPDEKPLRVTVRVREVSPYRLQYGGFYDTERGLGAIADLTNRNTFGNAAVLGLRARYDDTFREGRVYFGQPQLGGLPFDSNAVAFVSREIRLNAGFINDRMGFSLQQEKRLKNEFVLSWGYRFERDHTYEPGPDAFFDITLKVAPLTATFSRDVRDDILDASRGSFTSHNLEYAPKLLGSDLRFIRYFGQYFRYVPLSEPEEIPWSGGLRKSRFVYAGGVRLGLAHGFEEQRLVPSERFFAGGGTSIRGFEQDEVGPRNVIGDPAGGQSLFLMNHEMRFPVYHVVDGVGFFDLGNVYRNVRDLDPFDLRYSAGIGLRIRTPYFLLRGDLGFNLFPREGEKRSAFFFSIGQAF